MDSQSRTWPPIEPAELPCTVANHLPIKTARHLSREDFTDRQRHLLTKTRFIFRQPERRIVRARRDTAKKSIGIEPVRLLENRRTAMTFTDTNPHQPSFGNHEVAEDDVRRGAPD